MNGIISLEDVKKEYRNNKNITHAVNGITLGFEPGKRIAITGASGCGKTSLLNIIGLVFPPTSGEVSINGQATGKLTDRERAQYRNRFFGYIYQEYALVESYTVYENIEIPLLYAKDKMGWRKRRKAVEAVVESVGLSVKLDTKVSTLSGGQRQRVAVARAMINHPTVILADEPTGSLDSKNGELIMDLLDQFVLNQCTLIMVTHDLGLAARCDVHYEMQDGLIVQ